MIPEEADSHLEKGAVVAIVNRLFKKHTRVNGKDYRPMRSGSVASVAGIYTPFSSIIGLLRMFRPPVTRKNMYNMWFSRQTLGLWACAHKDCCLISRRPME